MSHRLVVAVGQRQQDLLAAVHEARRRGLEIRDAYSPYPVHGLPEAMGLAASRLPWAGHWRTWTVVVSLDYRMRSWIALLESAAPGSARHVSACVCSSSRATQLGLRRSIS